jgi:MFS family permease
LEPSAVDDELHDIKVGLEIEREISQSVSVMDMFRNPIDRRRTLLSVGAVALQGASGAMFMLIYGTYFFTMADMSKPFLDSVILTVVGVVVITIAFFYVRYFGRRNILMVGMFMEGIAMLVQACVYQHSPGTVSTGKVIVGMAVLYMIFYNGCVSAFAWMVGGEIPAQHLRSYTLGLASAVGFILGWIAAFTAPYFINPDDLNWGPKYGYIWFASNMVAVLWIFFFLPETKDRTLEELDEMFAARVPARKFVGYKCANLRIGEGEANEKVVMEQVELDQKPNEK